MFKVVKADFMNSVHFYSLDPLVLELNDYVNW
ncbi:IS3 family transposase [Sporosarcina sp. ANT_H38]